jgi:PAS domain S-box-containing protein
MKKDPQLQELDFKILFESLPGLYLILSPDLTIAEVSDAYLKATMTNRSEIIGRYLFDVFPDNPDDKTATGVSNLHASLNYVLHNGTAHTMAIQKYDIRRPDGTFEERYWSPLNKPVLNDKKDIVYIIHRVEDVTEFIQLKYEEEQQLKVTEELSKKIKQAEIETYKRAQEIQDINKKLLIEIKERKRLQDQLKMFNEELEEKVGIKTAELTDIFERVTDGFIALDKNFCYIYVNKKTGEMLQRNPSSLIGKNVWEEFPDAVGSATYKAFTEAMEKQVYTSNLDYYEPLDLWQENHIYPSPNGLSVFIRNITDQQKIKEKIEKEKDFSNSIINSLPGIFYLFDSNGKFLRWNKNFESVSGYDANEISNMHPIQFFDEDEKAYIASRIQEVFVKGVADAEAGFYTKDKNKVPHYFTGKLIMLDEGPCLIGMGINIAEKMKAEEELKKSYQHIRALATHLQNIREEERGSIAREIHDELGQQLTGLKMDIAWLNRKLGRQSEEVDEKFKSTLQLTDETVKTVRRIATELRPSILDDLGLIAAIEWHSSEFEKRFGIQTVFKTAITQLNLDPDIAIGLFRIYQESLTNVLRHADAKKISSSLSINKGILLLNISDNGKGFDIETVSDKKTLGLLGMKERTFIMGGEYEIKSKPGKGTSVTITVPLQRDNHNLEQH